jgi:spore coat polysaccharide biosynthesis protein SpsF
VKTGILIIARLGSTRLRDKHLIEVNGKTFIEWLAARFLEEFKCEIEKDEVLVFIATSTRTENKKFEDVFNDTPVHVFYGADENIPLRQLECALQHNLANIISIDGDDILCSFEAARKIYNALNTGIPSAKTSGLPIGLNCMGYHTSYLNKILEGRRDGKFETGWGRLFEGTMSDISMSDSQPDERLRFTLDYPEDEVFFATIINQLGVEVTSISDDNLIQFVTGNKLYEINESLREIYINNFNSQKQAEI